MSNPIPNALWFSRTLPTQEHINDARALGFNLVVVSQILELAALDLQTNEEVSEVIKTLFTEANIYRAHAVFGVFQTPFLHHMALTSNYAIQRGSLLSEVTLIQPLHCYAAWNTLHPQENEQPSPTHKRFLWIGYLAHPRDFSQK